MKTVWITGSSRGIGAAIALKLAEAGWDVILHASRRSAELKLTESSLGERHFGTVIGDLRSAAATANLWQEVIDLVAQTGSGGLQALVNNAGIYLPCAYHAEFQQWQLNRDETFRVNFQAPSELIYLAIQHFRGNNRGGRILNVVSRVGFRGEANASMYAASKAALINLTRSLAVEYANQGIELFGIAPGWVQTAMARDGMGDRLPEILAGIPMGRMATPEDCAHAAEFFLRDESKYLSGMILDINGASYFH